MSTPEVSPDRAPTLPEPATDEQPAVVCVRGADGEVVCGPVVDLEAPRPPQPLPSIIVAGAKHCAVCGAFYRKDFTRCPSDGGAIIATEIDPLLGQPLGHYVIDELLGEGGMGRVYRAHHAHLPDKRYAIKVLVGDVAATASMRKRFAKEAKIASKLDHPNLVAVLDYGASPTGLHYIVMELVDGIVLGDLIGTSPMVPVRVAAIAGAICDGLAYLHDAGLVHRDLKPDNVMVVATPTGEVPRLTDFGLAYTIEPGDERLTSTGVAMGTPAYAAPEQIAGKVVDLRADLYALGMSMFEMLAGGKLPWDGGAMEIATAKSHQEAPALGERVAGLVVPRDLERVVADLLRRRPSERPASARDVGAMLVKIAAGESAMTTAATPRRERRATPLVLGLIGGAVFVASAMLVWLLAR
jgi:serine/threonine protein kinase